MIFTKYFQRGDDDGEGEARVATVAEVWGAMILVCIADASQKIKFLFALHDRDKDHRMNRVEVSLSTAICLYLCFNVFRKHIHPLQFN